MAIVKFYRGDPNAPKPNMPTHLGANAIITYDGKLLLEKRRDCDIWGLVGGGVKKHETELQAITREVYEELGLRVRPEYFRKLAVYGEPGRIAAFQDGSIWRMVILVYALELEEAVKRGDIAAERHESFLLMYEELSAIPEWK